LASLKELKQKVFFGQKVESLISLSDHSSLSPKPAPDVYVEAMRQLGNPKPAA
jgi:beta-phosphoglucomutase-like phosphatase (HAD superfamily)